jgi:predicted signal transduction protein with EAL and GGDEF domain
LGHSAGDVLLQTLSQRMVGNLRATDTVLRLGGDEFVIILCSHAKSWDVVSATAQKIRAVIREPIQIEGHDIQITSSIGIATYPNDGKDPAALLTKADMAMYRAKELGRDNVQFFSQMMHVKTHNKLLLKEELRNALVREEFMLLYQPQVELKTGRIFGVEALIRWRHPLRGIVGPADFISLAEENGLIGDIGGWVLREACRQNKAWLDMGLPPLTVSVNVSPRQFRQQGLAELVASSLERSGLPARYLELELTESVVMQDVGAAVDILEQLRTLGVQVSIDDFGTGYSNLAALKKFPVARLKIDKSFVQDIATDESDRALASAIIALGRNLQLKVIAEGVETAEQVQFLNDNRCDEAQGYYFSRPVSAAEIQGLLLKKAFENIPSGEIARMNREEAAA